MTLIVQEIPLSQVVEDDIRLHRDPHALESLAQSLRAVGQLYPVRLRPVGERFAIVDGHRRCAALKAIGATTVQAIVEDETLAEAETLQKALISNIQRENLGPVDTAQAIRRLMDAAGWTISEAARQLGFSASGVTKTLAILDLPPAIVERIAAKQIPATAAYQLVRIDDPARQAELANKLAAGQLTRDRLMQTVRQRRQPAAKGVRRAVLKLQGGASLEVSDLQLDFDDFIRACEQAIAKAKQARKQRLSFQTFLKAAHDQAAGEE